MSAATGWWRCAECLELTDEPHTAEDGSDVCPACCVSCRSGGIAAWQEQLLKEGQSPYEVGDPMPHHGLPSREQSADAETRVRAWVQGKAS